MVFGRFFNTVKMGVKKGLRKVGGFLGRMSKPVLKGLKFAAGAASNFPGLVGSIAGVAHKGLDIVDSVISQLPESKAKNRLLEMSDKVGSVANTTSAKAADYAERLKKIGDAAAPVIDRVGQVAKLL